MTDLFYISLQYIRHHRVKLAVLTLAITLVGWLPLAIQSMVDQTAEQLLGRANSTPLVIGAPGSPLFHGPHWQVLGTHALGPAHARAPGTPGPAAPLRAAVEAGPGDAEVAERVEEAKSRVRNYFESIISREQGRGRVRAVVGPGGGGCSVGAGAGWAQGRQGCGRRGGERRVGRVASWRNCRLSMPAVMMQAAALTVAAFSVCTCQPRATGSSSSTRRRAQNSIAGCASFINSLSSASFKP